MIASLTGTVLKKEPSAVVVSVAGVGLRVRVTAQTEHLLGLGENVAFTTYLAVREDALDLYGFLEVREYDLFLLLLTLPGVGPKTALDILGKATVDTIIEAIADENPDHLTRMSGLGKKSAEKIVLGLKDKIAGLATAVHTTRRSADNDVIEAIMALGYSAQEARDAARSVDAQIVDIGARVKAALKNVNK